MNHNLTQYSSVNSSVKLHWLPAQLQDSDQHDSFGKLNNSTNSLHFANGNMLKIARANQLIDFECGAASQPRPRIRWFKLMPKMMTNFKDNNNKFYTQKQPQSQQTIKLMAMDESSIKSILMQSNDNHRASLSDFYPLELPHHNQQQQQHQLQVIPKG